MSAERALHWAENWAAEPAAWWECRLPTGPRPRQLSVKAFLIAVFLTRLDGRQGHLLRVHETLASLSPSDKNLLGVPEGVTYRHVTRLFSSMAALVDGSPVYTKRAEHRAELDPESSSHLEDRQEEIVDLLLESTIPAAYKDHGSYAVDWTDVEAWARPPTAGRPSVDTTAAWGRRRPKRSPPVGLGKRRKSNPSPPAGGNYPDPSGVGLWGWHEQILTMVHNEGSESVPALVRAATLTAANRHQAPLSLASLARLRSRGIPAGDLLADAAYSYADGWSTGASALGYSLVVDVNNMLLGRHGTAEGAIVVDDIRLCPMTPEALIDVQRPPYNATEADWEAYFATVEERDHYSFVKHGRPNDEGDQRAKCPAECGKVRCAAKDPSMSNPYSAPEITAGPTPPPRCCTQTTVTFRRPLSEKIDQKHAYYSPEWHASYDRRTAVERSFAVVKDKAGVDMTFGAIRFFGAAKHRLMRVIGWAVVNYKVLVNFDLWRTDPARRRRKPRRRKHFTEALNNMKATTPAAFANAPPTA